MLNNIDGLNIELDMSHKILGFRNNTKIYKFLLKNPNIDIKKLALARLYLWSWYFLWNENNELYIPKTTSWFRKIWENYIISLYELWLDTINLQKLIDKSYEVVFWNQKIQYSFQFNEIPKKYDQAIEILTQNMNDDFIVWHEFSDKISLEKTVFVMTEVVYKCNINSIIFDFKNFFSDKDMEWYTDKKELINFYKTIINKLKNEKIAYESNIQMNTSQKVSTILIK